MPFLRLRAFRLLDFGFLHFWLLTVFAIRLVAHDLLLEIFITCDNRPKNHSTPTTDTTLRCALIVVNALSQHFVVAFTQINAYHEQTYVGFKED
jgi:hypothetical protein